MQRVFFARGAGGSDWQLVISGGIFIRCGVAHVIFCKYACVQWVFIL